MNATFITRLAIPVILTSLLPFENYGPELVGLFDRIGVASDRALSNAKGEGESPTESFDYIVVGGGSAGLPLVNRLSASGEYTVLLLEGGGDPNPIVDIPIARKHLFRTPADLIMGYGNVPQENACVTNGCGDVRGKALGGTSVINGALYNRCQAKDYDEWANFTGDSGWAFNGNVLDAFKRIEDYRGYFENDPGPNHGVGGEVYVGKLDYMPGADVILQALAEQGVPIVDLNTGLTPHGFSKTEYNIKDGLRATTYHAFLEPILGRGNLYVYRYAWATKIHLNAEKRAVGVSYNRHGQSRHVAANKEIIICAGTYESPKLLMLSGIGPAEHLAAHGIRVEIDNSAVGNYLQDHISIRGRAHPFVVNETFGTASPFTDETLLQFLENGTGPLNNFDYWNEYTPQLVHGYTPSAIYNDVSRPDVHSYVYEQYHEDDGVSEERFWLDHTLQRPESYGTVRLASNKPEDNPLIDPRYLTAPNDVERLLDGLIYIQNLFLSSPTLHRIGLKWSDSRTLNPNCSAFLFPSRDYWKCHIKFASLTNTHPTSTCRMGPNGTVAVVDSRLRVFGATGLRVADCSVMPFVPSGNTNFPAMMVGDVAARLILEDAEDH